MYFEDGADAKLSQSMNVVCLALGIGIRRVMDATSKNLGLGCSTNPLYICYEQLKRAWPRVSLPCTGDER